MLQSLFYSTVSLIHWFVQCVCEFKHSRRATKQLATKIWSSGKRTTPWLFKMYPFISSTIFLWWVRDVPRPPKAHSLLMTEALRDSLPLVCDNQGPQVTLGWAWSVSGVEGDRSVIKVEMEPETQIREMARCWWERKLCKKAFEPEG